MNQRAYRVTFVTADEAEYLNRNGKNELARCCGHLECFHVSGKTSEGGDWSFCNVDRCHCSTETPPDPSIERRAALRAALDRAERTAAAFGWFGLGAALCGLVWALTEVLR